MSTSVYQNTINASDLKNVSDWLNYMGSIHVSAIDMGFERVLPIANQLQLFEFNEKKPYIFTVAGTNGKGSTTSAIANICQQAGLKTALYQSPHLISFNERIQINGQIIDDDSLISAFSAVEAARVSCQLTLSFFEMTTLAAFYIFQKQNCDVWVLEIGLGGRLDVVNIFDADLCVITNVGIDHTDWLGDTREKIAFEKAGILRKNRTLIFGEKDLPNSLNEAICYHQNTMIQFGRDFYYTKNANSFIYSAKNITLSLPNIHISPINASIAISAILASNLNIHINHIIQGIKNTRLNGRFDKRDLKNRHWLFDVGHNEHGIHFLLNQFKPYWQNFNQKNPTAKLHIVFSMLADKDNDAVLSLISKANLPIYSWHIGKINNVRASSPNALINNLLHHIPNACYQDYDSVAASVFGAVNASNEGDLILCFGSFYTISESLIALGAEHQPKS